MTAWSVSLGGKAFTFLSGDCKTVDDVKEAMFEKFCRAAVSVNRL